MAKSHYLIACAVIFVSGVVALLMDIIQLGLCLTVPSVLIGVIIAANEPSAPEERKTPDESRQFRAPPAQPVTASHSGRSASPPHVPLQPLVSANTPVTAQASQGGVSTAPADGPDGSQRIDELTTTLSKLREERDALARLANDKSREAESLAARLKDRRDIKILQRVAQFQHVLEFNRLMMNSGKIAPDAALREFEFELESSMDTLGIKVHPIDVGAKVRDLPNGSFELINGEPPSSPELAGTVKAVRQSALTYTDPEGNTHFLIPAKIDAYKLS
jgi:hypothetical protein